MCFINNVVQPLGKCGGSRMAMWWLIIQGTWEIKSAESRQHPPPSPLPVIIYSHLSFFFFFSPHLAAFQSIPINIQCLCTLSSCLSKWHNPWMAKKRWQTQDFLLFSTFTASTFIHSKLYSYKSINTCSWQRRQEKDQQLLSWCSYQRGLRWSCLGADYLQQPEFQPLEI